MLGNNLDKETSPYLLQHRDNPVHWQPWGPEAIAVARRENKPILLSIGYSACHWCHVMAHESFENPEIAALMNELFINIKVDREERPDLDAIYQTALALLGQHGGWPLTMFLTPSGEPFWGGTYFPPTSRYGRPGFADVLRTVHSTYKNEPEKVERNRAALVAALADLSQKQPAGSLPRSLTDEAARRLLEEVDFAHGGFGSAPKFPQATAVELLWRAYRRTGSKDFRLAVLLTAERMCQGGIYDHLGGGFARYAVDERWLVPHFEKMLYDNALLVDLLTQLWQDSREPLFATRIDETVGWALTEMLTPEGAFASALDADSDGGEGAFYLWTEAEIDALLGEDSTLVKAYYDVTPQGNWEGRTILNRSGRPPSDDPAVEERLGALRATLWKARELRPRPGRDDKMLTDWNGLMIAALAHAGAVFERAEWTAAAERAFTFIATHMRDGDRLLHSYRNGQGKHTAVLDDYANMARAALALHEVTGKAAYLTRARDWVTVVDRHFWDHDGAGYFFTADDADDLITRTKSAADSATPAGNATMVAVLARLFHLTGNERYRERADAVVSAFGADAKANLAGLASLFNSNELLIEPVQVVVSGDRKDAPTRDLLRAVYDVCVPNRILTVVPPGAALPQSHPAAGKTLRDGRATAYVCVGPTCSAPLTEPEALREALNGS
ncbi:MAG: thioredoxin domain-containing protein [Alphaproteobacteria bacterium]